MVSKLREIKPLLQLTLQDSALKGLRWQGPIGHRILGLFGCCLAISCATTSPDVRPKLGAAEQTAMGRCFPSQGGLQFKMSQDDVPIYAFEGEWIAEIENDWIFQALNPLGRPVFRITYQDGQLSSESFSELSLPEIDTTPEGFLRLSGHEIPIKARELPCYLGRVIPRSWMPALSEVTRVASGERRITFEEPKRQIVWNSRLAEGISKNLPEDHLPVAVIKLSRSFWLDLFRYHLIWQLTPKTAVAPSAMVSKLTWNNYIIEWVDLDET